MPLCSALNRTVLRSLSLSPFLLFVFSEAVIELFLCCSVSRFTFKATVPDVGVLGCRVIGLGAGVDYLFD